ncbi:hypothetical protein BST36_27750 [Mycolicibacterium moriokaense]|uniref:Uncharacterized protein n=1 Tax=Mycolicibacterium moriokaense TaxID=39691 RepID=A0AAD1M554_9MYCO|nr:hypothetical protein [Mycolicibacterium moriokaense]MCV7041336.1 hypothetical protein [Mycolicibacterium moriokaense]ORB14914.1 hypothetical protein BST36_27750 [Mycolicibacterium moriokaense]BBX00903.1 hypothetical protein MMOR_18390 [Mycolicibacterium moriokaense]
MSIFEVPENPSDPEAAALELIVRLPQDLLGKTWPPLDVLQELTAALEIAGAFTGMSWHDAKHAAVAIIVDAVNSDDAVPSLCQRAERAVTGTDGMTWDDPAAMARALTTGAKVLAA